MTRRSASMATTRYCSSKIDMRLAMNLLDAGIHFRVFTKVVRLTFPVLTQLTMSPKRTEMDMFWGDRSEETVDSSSLQSASGNDGGCMKVTGIATSMDATNSAAIKRRA
jgi:hypothetical protein